MLTSITYYYNISGLLVEVGRRLFNSAVTFGRVKVVADITTVISHPESQNYKELVVMEMIVSDSLSRAEGDKQAHRQLPDVCLCKLSSHQDVVCGLFININTI